VQLAPGRTPTQEPRRSFAAFPTSALGVEGEEGEEAACILLSGLPMDHAGVKPHVDEGVRMLVSSEGVRMLVSSHQLHVSCIPYTAFALCCFCLKRHV